MIEQSEGRGGEAQLRLAVDWLIGSLAERLERHCLSVTISLILPFLPTQLIDVIEYQLCRWQERLGQRQATVAAWQLQVPPSWPDECRDRSTTISVNGDLNWSGAQPAQPGSCGLVHVVVALKLKLAQIIVGSILSTSA